MSETKKQRTKRPRKSTKKVAVPVVEPTKGERIIAWIEKHLRIPEGQHQGEPFKLLPFQKEFIRLVYDNPAGTRQAILSIPRKNGKSVLTSALMLAQLMGPFASRNSQLFSCAMSSDQARVIYRHAAAMILQSPTLSRYVKTGKIKLKDSTKEIVVVPLANTFKSIPNNPKAAHGASPIMYIYDEIGQIVGPRDRLYEAMQTGGGAHKNPLSILISTQAENDGDLLSMLIDRAMAGSNPHNVCMLFTADPKLDPFSEDALIAANPSWEFINQEDARNTQKEARASPSAAPAFRNLVLNQRVAAETRFVAEEIWNANAGQPDDWHGRDLVVGLDLSQVSDLTAMTVAHKSDDPSNNKISIKQYFWLPADGLEAKAESDKQPWDIWRDAGYIETTPGRTIDYTFVATRLKELVDGARSVTVHYDNAMIGEFRRAMAAVGFSEAWMSQNMHNHRQGFISMAPAVNALERALLDERLLHGNNPVLTTCLKNVVVKRDPAGNRKFDKSSASRKIDGAVTLAMAVGQIAGGEEKPGASHILSAYGGIMFV